MKLLPRQLFDLLKQIKGENDVILILETLSGYTRYS